MGLLPIQRAYYNQKRKKELLTQILQDEDTIATLSALLRQDEQCAGGGVASAINVNHVNANLNMNGHMNGQSMSQFQVEEQRSRYKRAKQEVTSAHGGTYELYRDFSNVFD